MLHLKIIIIIFDSRFLIIKKSLAYTDILLHMTWFKFCILVSFLERERKQMLIMNIYTVYEMQFCSVLWLRSLFKVLEPLLKVSSSKQVSSLDLNKESIIGDRLLNMLKLHLLPLGLTEKFWRERKGFLTFNIQMGPYC